VENNKKEEQAEGADEGIVKGTIKFCPDCGYESASEEDICPVCSGKMNSLSEEANKISIKKKSDIFDDSDVSLDEVAQKEEEQEGEGNSENV